MGLTLFAEHNIAFTDELDNVISGKRDDHFYRAGLGLNFYLSPPKYESTRDRELKRQQERDLRLLREENRKNLEGIVDTTKEDKEKLKELRKANKKAQKENN